MEDNHAHETDANHDECERLKDVRIFRGDIGLLAVRMGAEENTRHGIDEDIRHYRPRVPKGVQCDAFTVFVRQFVDHRPTEDIGVALASTRALTDA